MMGVGKIMEMGEEHGEVWLRIAKGNAQQDALLALPTTGSALDIGQVIVSDRLELEAIAGGEKAKGNEGGDRARRPQPQAEDEEDNEDYPEADEELLAPSLGRCRRSRLESI